MKTIKFLKDVKSTLTDGSNIDAVFKTWFVCKPLIENCIVPQMQSCKQTCQIDQLVYAPDLSVGHPDSRFHGIVYDEKNKQLLFKVVNNGLGYAWDIDIEASYAHTKNRDGKTSGGQQLFKEKGQHLIYLGARNGPPKTVSDYVTDFLIEESNFSNWLQGFKSDADDYNVPNYWIKAVRFEPIEGELNRVIMNVDPGNNIPESNEINNTYVFDLDMRPTPARFSIENFSTKLVAQTLDSFMTSFRIRNNGEENGPVKVRIFEGKYQENKNPIFQSEQTVMGKNVFDFDAIVRLDSKKETDPYCGKMKQYTLTVTDEDGNKTERDFWLTIYVGSVSGKVVDLFGKKIPGTKITASSGEEATVNSSGIYHLKEISSLGNITVTASHPDYSQEESKNLTFRIENEFKPCTEGGLDFYSVDFILKNKPVTWQIIFKDKDGHLLNGTILAANDLFRNQVAVNGKKTIPDLQPGEYYVTANVSGYYPIFKKIALNPPEETTDFVFEKVAGRENDDGLRIIAPRLLWTKRLGQGGGIIGNLNATKNGKTLTIEASNNNKRTSKLYFVDPLSGKTIKEVDIPYVIGQQRNVGLDASYDGRTIGLFINPGAPGKTDKERVLSIFNATGDKIGGTTLNRQTSIFLDVSPDGFYLYPNALINSSLHKYTRREVEGVGYGHDLQSYGSYVYFLRNGNLVSNCKGKETGWCERTINDDQIRKIADLKNMPRIMDQSYDGSALVIRTDEKIYYFGSSVWEKDSPRDNSFISASISPGGLYVITTEGSGGNLALKVYGNGGGNKTPSFKYNHVRYVSANDKGLFFAQITSDKIAYYQIGAYQKDYNPPASPVTNTKKTNFLTDFFGFFKNFFNKKP